MDRILLAGQSADTTMLNHVHDAGSGELVLIGNFLKIDVGGKGNLVREGLAPQLQALLRLRERKINDGMEATHEGVVDIAFKIGGQDGQAIVIFNSLQQIGNFLIGVFVVGVPYFCPFTKNGIGLVKKQDPVFVLGLIKEAGQVFLRFADIFGDDHRQVDAKDGFVGVLAEQGGRHGFSGARRAIKKGPVSWFQFFAHFPLVHQNRLVVDPIFQFFDLVEGFGVEHQVGPFQLRKQVLGRKGRTHFGYRHAAGGKEFDVFGIEHEFAAHERFAGFYRVEVQNFFFGQEVFMAEQPLIMEAFFDIISRQQKKQGFAGRKHASVRVALFFKASELGHIASVGQKLSNDGVKKIGDDVGGQARQNGIGFLGTQLVIFDKTPEGFFGIGQSNIGNRKSIPALFRFGKMTFEAKPRQFLQGQQPLRDVLIRNGHEDDYSDLLFRFHRKKRERKLPRFFGDVFSEVSSSEVSVRVDSERGGSERVPSGEDSSSAVCGSGRSLGRGSKVFSVRSSSSVSVVVVRAPA